jgi:hypothetical protein
VASNKKPIPDRPSMKSLEEFSGYFSTSKVGIILDNRTGIKDIFCMAI